MSGFLPVSYEDMVKMGWDQVDFAYVIGDAYVDHPSFGHAIISRILTANGYKVGIISQPDWKDKESINIFGKPRLGFLVSAGNMDSMVNHYSVSKKHRKTDAYTPGGVMGKRPDNATIVYGNLIRQTYKDIPIIIGGIEASLRRMAHYDYWSDSLKKSILLDSGSDIISYGMGEKSIIEIADALNSGLAVSDITFVRGTVYKHKGPVSQIENEDTITLPTYDEIFSNKKTFAESFYTQYLNTDAISAKTLIEPYGAKLQVVQNPPAMPLSEREMDDVYDLPFMRTYHPSYEKQGGVPAISEVKFSIISNRGCLGACNFCSLNFHQGRIIQSRSHESIINEAKKIIKDKDFKGYIHDVGGPTANFRNKACDKQESAGACKEKQCLFPTACKNLKVNHEDYVNLLKKLRALDGVKKVFVRSGIRFDYLIYDKDKTFFNGLIKHHISGQLKVAPEHVSNNVLYYMGKPEISVFKRFSSMYKELNKKNNMDQYLVLYLMSSHPGSTLNDAIELSEYLRDIGFSPEQVQDFYPTPGALSTCMYYTEIDPRTMKKVYVPKDPHEKAMQRALMQYRNPKLYDLVKEALKKAGRDDLIGFDAKCLIKPRGGAGNVKERTSTNTKEKPFTKRNATKDNDKLSIKSKITKNIDVVMKENMGSSRKNHKKKTIRNVHKKKA